MNCLLVLENDLLVYNVQVVITLEVTWECVYPDNIVKLITDLQYLLVGTWSTASHEHGSNGTNRKLMSWKGSVTQKRICDLTERTYLYSKKWTCAMVWITSKHVITWIPQTVPSFTVTSVTNTACRDVIAVVLASVTRPLRLDLVLDRSNANLLSCSVFFKSSKIK